MPPQEQQQTYDNPNPPSDYGNSDVPDDTPGDHRFNPHPPGFCDMAGC